MTTAFLRRGLLAGGAVLAVIAGPAGAKDVVIHAGTLIDGASSTPRRQVSIIIKDDRIASVESGFQTPPGAEVIDLSGKTVLPGFIDAHDHISSTGSRRPLNRFVLNLSLIHI